MKLIHFFVVALFALGAHAVKANMMLPLDTCVDSHLNPVHDFYGQVHRLREAGFDGCMVDVWWGATEPKPGKYDFACYRELADLLHSNGLELHAVLSFHAAGGNIGDAVYIPIPDWARRAAREHAGGFYVDADGFANEEVLALQIDEVPLLPGHGSRRTPVQAYADWSRAFRRALGPRVADTLTGIEIGLGPAGELRYPSYRPETFPRLGEFQAYSKQAIADFAAAARAAGHPEWTGPPTDVCNRGYDCMPADSRFFHDGIWSEYGKFFVNWYANELIKHADRVMAGVDGVFGDLHRADRMEYSVKIAGIHWLFADPSHAAEVTAGYPNCANCVGYIELAKLCARYGASMDITCVEKVDDREPPNALARPGTLARSIADAVVHAPGAIFSGENALPCTDRASLGRAVEVYRYASDIGAPLGTYTHLRWTNDVLANLNNFRWMNEQLHALK